jgi:hypothetical protein
MCSEAVYLLVVAGVTSTLHYLLSYRHDQGYVSTLPPYPLDQQKPQELSA